MILVCPGGWSDAVTHAPAIIGERAPADDARVSHGACDACIRALRATVTCRLCGRVETRNGLCDRCEHVLLTHVGKPAYALTVYRQEGVLAGNYDGAGVMERLRVGMGQPDYRGFALARLPVRDHASEEKK